MTDDDLECLKELGKEVNKVIIDSIDGTVEFAVAIGINGQRPLFFGNTNPIRCAKLFAECIKLIGSPSMRSTTAELDD